MSFIALYKDVGKANIAQHFSSDKSSFVDTYSNRVMSREALLEESRKVRDIARYLGPSWPIRAPIIGVTDFSSEENFITGYTDFDTVWRSLSAGSALYLIAKEIEIIDLNSSDIHADFTVTSRIKDEEIILKELPLIEFCRILYEHLRKEYSR